MVAAAAACGGGSSGAPDAGGPRDWPAMDVPASTMPEPGIRRDLVLVPGVAPPPNPMTGDATPAALDVTQVLRYRQDVDPPATVRAVIVAMPGFLGGGGSLDALARALVRRGAATGTPVEVWAIDRRANLLEERVGLDTAEAAGEAEIALNWYFGIDTIDGERFPGFRRQADLAFMSEWGLATHVEDLRRVIARIPAAERRGRVFLLGHSLGASFSEAYAAWRFSDGTRGVDELAGIVLIDGVLADTPIAEDQWHAGTGAGFFKMPGVDAIRAGARYFELPLLGISVYAQAEIMSLRALLDPDGVVEDEVRDDTLRILLLLGDGPMPRLTNQAVLGLAFDAESCPLAFAAINGGRATGGPLESYDNPFGDGTLVHPTDGNVTYAWIDALAASPPEHTPIANLAHSFVDGRTNFAEWYFPARLPIDLAAVGGARVAEDGWQAALGLRAFDGALIDAPILAVSAGFVEPARFEPLRARVAPAVGAGRPRQGATRAEDDGFRVLRAEGLTHMDPITADESMNPVPAAVLEFVGQHGAAGAVALPAD